MSPDGMTLHQWSAEARTAAIEVHERLAGTMRESRRIWYAVLETRLGRRPAIQQRIVPAEPVAAARYAIVGLSADGRRDVLMDDLPLAAALGMKDNVAARTSAARILVAMHVSQCASAGKPVALCGTP